MGELWYIRTMRVEIDEEEATVHFETEKEFNTLIGPLYLISSEYCCVSYDSDSPYVLTFIFENIEDSRDFKDAIGGTYNADH